MPRSRSAVLAAALLLVCAPAPAHAQDELRPPPDWKVRADRPDQAPDATYFVEMPPGWHITTGPAVILWDPAATAEGTFAVESEVFLFDPRGRREAFGIFVGGRDLEGPEQAYVYFLVREGGEFLVKRRAGGGTETLVDWTAHPAVLSWAGRGDGETARNVLRLEARAGEVRFLVNGEEVAALPRAGLPPLDGVVGLRVNHGLNLHVTRLDVEPR